nr:homolog of EHV2 ORF74 membrane protein G74 [Macronycteris gammaherpesvirus 1]BEG23147.1 homolog of EHV2 ORF74 membrane protein G74 [Macronycteris gammaherpesvirus 1]
MEVINVDFSDMGELFDNFSDMNYSDDYNFSDSGICENSGKIPSAMSIPLLLLILLFALLGNVWLLFKLIQNAFKKVCHVFLLAMCVNAFIGCLVIILHLFESYVTMSPFMCKVSGFLFNMYVFFGAFIVCLLCFDTWCAIWLPAAKSSSAVMCGLCCCLVVIVVAICLSIPRALFLDVIVTIDNQTICHLNSGAETVYVSSSIRVMVNICGFVLPFLFLIFFYGMCIYRLCKARFRAKYRTMRIILFLIFLFFICWGPHHLFNFLDGLVREGFLTDSCFMRDILNLGIEFSSLWGLCYAALQPLLYACLNSQLRARLFKCFCKC